MDSFSLYQLVHPTYVMKFACTLIMEKNQICYIYWPQCLEIINVSEDGQKTHIKSIVWCMFLAAQGSHSISGHRPISITIHAKR